MVSKLVYEREQLLAIRGTITDFGISEEQQRTLAVIEDGSTDVYSAAPSAHAVGGSSSSKKTSAAGGITSRTAGASVAAPTDPVASRFSSDKRWESTKGEAKAPRDTGRSWRGGRDKETFEEGYLYELKQTAKHKQVLQSAVAEIERETEVKRLQDEGRKLEALKKKIDEAKTVASAAEPSGRAQPPAATLSPVGDDQAADAEFSAGKKHSRFFGGSSESTAAAKPIDDVPDRRAATHHDPVVDFMAPSSNVVWNHKTAAPAAPTSNPTPSTQASTNPLTPLAISGAVEEKSLASNTAAAPSSVVSKITVGAAQPSSKQKSTQRVWSAADLEQQLMGQSTVKPQPLIGQPTTNLGVFDASQLEHQLLAKAAPSANTKATAGSAPAVPGQAAAKSIPTAPASAGVGAGIAGGVSLSGLHAQQQPQPVPSILPTPAFGAPISVSPQGGGFAVLSAPTSAGGSAAAHPQPQMSTPSAASPQFLIASSEQQQQQLARYLQSIGHQLPPSGGVVQLTAQQLAQLGAVQHGRSSGGGGAGPLGVAPQQQAFAVKLPQGGMPAVSGGYSHAHTGVPQQASLSNGGVISPSSQQQGTHGNWIVQQSAVSQAVGGTAAMPQQLSSFHANPSHYHPQHTYQQFQSAPQAQSVARLASPPVTFPAQTHVMQHVALPTAPRPPLVSVGGTATAPHLPVSPAMLYGSGQQQPINIPFRGHTPPNR